MIYDQSSNILSFFVQILQENQQKVREYIGKHYENVQVMIMDNWMRLDFDQDGQVDINDIKRGVHELYEFLISFDYLQKATEIKSTLYNEAIKYMKKDLQMDEKNRESHIDENDQKVESILN